TGPSRHLRTYRPTRAPPHVRPQTNPNPLVFPSDTPGPERSKGSDRCFLPLNPESPNREPRIPTPPSSGSSLRWASPAWRGYDDLTVIPRKTKRHGDEKAAVRRTRAERAARRRQLRQAVLAGATPADVAAQYGVNRNLVYAACGRGELHAAAVRRRRELA